MAFDTPAFPTIDLARMMGRLGLTAHGVFTLAALTRAGRDPEVAAQRAAIHRKYREARP